jgi:tyrosine decarboxylase/aspartate 1-decarboxylase
VPAAEFDLPAGHVDAPGLPAVRFPEDGRPEADVIDDVRGRFDEDRYAPEQNFSITYSGIPSAISQQVETLARGRFFVEWARETELGTWSMEREAVAMMASLLGGGETGTAGGFMTTGGTESNLAAMRLARNTGSQTEPEIIAPVTMHFSFRLGAELMGIRLVEVDVDDKTYLPHIEDVERAITPRTVGLICSAPGGSFGVLDPVEAFADLARRTGLYLHVDAAFGGFILPFMRDLGYDIPPFDLSLPGVSSISTDGHKLGLLPIATGFFLVKDAAILESIPTERTLIHTTSSTKPGSRAAAAWATLRHLGRDGYRRSTAHVIHLADVIAEGVIAIEGMELAAPRFISIVGFTSTSIDLELVHRLLAEDGWGQGYGVTRGKPFIRLSIHPSRDEEHARAFVAAFAGAVAMARRT